MNSKQRNQDNDNQTIGQNLREEATRTVNRVVDTVAERIEQRSLFNSEELKVESPRTIGPIGRRIVVPVNEVHVVTGAGPTIALISHETQIFGKLDDQTSESVYWLNPKTVVVGLRTNAFTVEVVNIRILDANNVEAYVDLHMIAQLDRTKAQLAASAIGGNIQLLVDNIEQIATTEITNAAAKVPLIEVIKDRNTIGVPTEQKVIESLQKVGYTLINLRIGELTGIAADMLVAQSNAEITRDSTAKISEATEATLRTTETAKQRKAEIEAQTARVEKEKEFAKDQAIDAAEKAANEAKANTQQAFDLAQKTREQNLARRDHEVQLEKDELKKAADLARTAATAEVALNAQQQEDTRLLQVAKATAERKDLEQQRDLTRANAKTTADVERLKTETQAESDRDKAKRITAAQSEAEALKIKTDSESDARLKKATTDAQASQQESAAKAKLAEATRAEQAAEGLAKADVREADIKNEAAQVNVEKDRGFAEAAIAKQNAETQVYTAEAELKVELERLQGQLKVELDRQKEQAALFANNPQLFQLEMMRVQQAHALQMRQAELNAQVQIAQAMAANTHINLNLIGDGGKVSQGMAQVMAIMTGIQTVGNQIPAVGNILGMTPAISTNGHNDDHGDHLEGFSLTNALQSLRPFVVNIAREMNPRVFSTMTVAGMIEAVTPMLSGRADLLSTVARLKEESSIKMIMDAPIAPILASLGITGKADDSALAIEDAETAERDR